jgi:TATA-binding protein-associated factor Taf7
MRKNGREFDPYDIVANLLGAAVAIGACTWYHKRMLDRKRQARQYNLVSGEEDVELGEGASDHERQESGVTGTRAQTLEEEVDNWDENNWEDDEPTATEGSGEAPEASDAEADGASAAKEPKKRSD